MTTETSEIRNSQSIQSLHAKYLYICFGDGAVKQMKNKLKGLQLIIYKASRSSIINTQHCILVSLCSLHCSETSYKSLFTRIRRAQYNSSCTQSKQGRHRAGRGQ
jgi:hypothetical protein